MQTTDPNPYAAPADLAAAAVPATTFYFRDGDFLVVRDGAELPPVCPVTNTPVDGGWRKKVSIAWSPPWVFLLILINLIVLLIVMLIVQKKAKITYSLSPAARKKISRRKTTGWLLLLTSIGVLAAAIMDLHAEGSPLFFIGGFALLIASLIPFIIANPLKPVKWRDGWFRIKGCSKDFLATLPVHPSPF